MKKILLITILLSFAFVANGCSDDDNDKKTNNSIIGTWKLTETGMFDYQGGNYWHSVENGYTRTFETNETFTSNQFLDCTYGTYILSETEGTLSLIYGCEGFTEGGWYGGTFIEGTFIENYAFSGQYLILTPTYYCGDEGCSYKFKRIN